VKGRKMAALALASALVLSGCGWMDGSYVSVTPHQVGLGQTAEGDARTVNSYVQLRSELIRLVESGTAEGLFSLAEYPLENVQEDMERAAAYITDIYPVGAYAVESIDYDVGTGLGASALAVDIAYCRSPEQIGSIRAVRRIAGAEEAIGEALDQCAQMLVLQVSGYQEADFEAIVTAYAQRNPDRVMETPGVTVRVCPDRGDTRVVELTFQYNTDRQTLRSMREQVQPVFSSAALYVSGQAEDWTKFSQLHAFLMERFDYTLETSVTPAYSLLCRGVGDSRAFAQVYSAMCVRIGLEAKTVSGTRNGEVHWWNQVKIGEGWYHLDLLDSAYFHPRTDAEMTHYDWDRSAYPAATGAGV
jgi:hypothetical protein